VGGVRELLVTKLELGNEKLPQKLRDYPLTKIKAGSKKRWPFLLIHGIEFVAYTLFINMYCI